MLKYIYFLVLGTVDLSKWLNFNSISPSVPKIKALDRQIFFPSKVRDPKIKPHQSQRVKNIKFNKVPIFSITSAYKIVSNVAKMTKIHSQLVYNT